MIITTLDNVEVDTAQVKCYNIAQRGKHYPHWVWCVLTLLLFWPAVLLYIYIGETRKKYQVGLIYHDNVRESHWLDEPTLNDLKYNSGGDYEAK